MSDARLIAESAYAAVGQPKLSLMSARRFLVDIFHLVGVMILFYDHAITFVDEISYVWRRPKTRGSYLFLFNRYFGFFGGVAVTGLYFSPMTRRTCQSVNLFRQMHIVVSQIIVSMLMLIRVYAVFARDRRVLAGLLLYAVVGVSLAGWALSGVSVVWLTMLAYDLIVFGLTAGKTLAAVRRPRAPPLIHVLLRDGALYFGVLSMSNLANILTYYPYLKGALATAVSSLAVTLLSRMMLNLHGGAAVGILSGSAGGYTGAGGGAVAVFTRPNPHGSSLRVNTNSNIRTFVLSIAAIGQWACVLIRAFKAFILWEDGRHASWFYYSDTGPSEVTRSAFHSATILIADLFVISRLWVISDHRRGVIALPMLSAAGLLAMIVWYILRVYARSPNTNVGSKIKSVMLLMAESAFVYTSFALAWQVAYGMNHVSAYFIEDCIPPVAALAAVLVHVRAVLGIGREDRSTRWNTTVSRHVLRRAIYPHEWTTLLHLTTHVKNLRAVDDMRVSPFGGIGIKASTVYDDLSRYMPHFALFPNLEDLEVASVGSSPSVMRMFASDKLAVLGLYPVQTDLGVAASLDALYFTMPQARTRLTRLVVTNSLRTDYEGGDALYAEMPFVTALRDLVALEDLSVFYLSRLGWASVSRIPHLHTLQVTQSDRSIPTAHELAKGTSAFDELWNLTLEGDLDISLLCAIFRMRRPGQKWSLMHFHAGNVRLDSGSLKAGWTSPVDAYNLIARHVSQDTLQALSVCTTEGVATRGLAQPMELVPRFAELTNVSLKHSRGFSEIPYMISADVYRVAYSWPMLEQLSLHVFCPLSALAAFAENCPRLTSMDASVVVDIVCWDKLACSTSLLQLTLNVCSDADRRDICIAQAFARAVFPTAELQFKYISGPFTHFCCEAGEVDNGGDDGMNVDSGWLNFTNM
ncbi:hypothetical protein HDZ31DRAFT_75513 [Schizophyllum fasciatum]